MTGGIAESGTCSGSLKTHRRRLGREVAIRSPKPRPSRAWTGHPAQGRLLTSLGMTDFASVQVLRGLLALEARVLNRCGGPDLGEQCLVLLLQPGGKLGVRHALGLVLALGNDELDELLDGFCLLRILALLWDEKERQTRNRIGVFRCRRGIDNRSADVL